MPIIYAVMAVLSLITFILLLVRALRPRASKAEERAAILQQEEEVADEQDAAVAGGTVVEDSKEK